MYRNSKNENKKNVVCYDFFCGVGGVSYGFKSIGIKPVVGVDIDNKAGNIFTKNIEGAKFLHADIKNQKYIKENIESELKKFSEAVSIFIACAPCQPFSVQNRNHLTDERKELLKEFIELLETFNSEDLPHFIFIENVGTIKSRGAIILNEIIERLEKKHFVSMGVSVLNASNYEVPQSRKRMVMLFYNIKKIKIAQEKFNWAYFEKKYSRPPITVRQAIGHLSALEAGQTDPHNPLHTCRKLSEKNYNKIKSLTKPGDDRTNYPEDEWLPCHHKHDGHKDNYSRMWWDKPAPTMTTKCISFSNGRFGHPEQNRSISLLEAAIFQTMGNYDFGPITSKNEVAKFIGNAVPPKLASKIGEFILELIETDN
mgnify:CR=1 FL=1|jgi:DNA (cytosine-5)-methyltransferase 1